MNGKRKWLLWVAVVSVLVLGLAACSAEKTTTPVETEAAVETPVDAAVVVTEASAVSTEAATATEAETEAAAWSPDLDCSTCHDDVAASVSDSTMLAGFHVAQGNACTDCHDADVLVSLHAGTAHTEEDKLATTAKCQSCHGSYADLKAKTVNSTAIIDAAGNAVNPHDTHQGEVDCFNCHTGHLKFDPYRYCKTCHHDTLESCSNCHDE